MESVAVFVPAGTVFDDPDTGERTEVLASPIETGDRYRIRLTLPAGSKGPERHRHPDLTEAFEVRAGEVGFRLGREVSRLRSGERRLAPRDTTHALWNAGAGPAELDVDIAFGPGGPRTSADIVRFGALYAAIAQERGRPSLLQLGLLLDEFGDAYAMPVPESLQRLIVRPVAALARRRGYRAAPDQ